MEETEQLTALVLIGFPVVVLVVLIYRVKNRNEKRAEQKKQTALLQQIADQGQRAARQASDV